MVLKSPAFVSNHHQNETEREREEKKRSKSNTPLESSSPFSHYRGSPPPPPPRIKALWLAYSRADVKRLGGATNPGCRSVEGRNVHVQKFAEGNRKRERNKRKACQTHANRRSVESLFSFVFDSPPPPFFCFSWCVSLWSNFYEKFLFFPWYLLWFISSTQLHAGFYPRYQKPLFGVQPHPTLELSLTPLRNSVYVLTWEKSCGDGTLHP